MPPYLVRPPPSLPLFSVLSRFATELGSGPFSLVSAVSNDTAFGVNRTSSTVFPLLRERPEQMPSRGIMFNFMVTAGMQRDRTSRECPFSHTCVSQKCLGGGGEQFILAPVLSQASLWCHWSLRRGQIISSWCRSTAALVWNAGVGGRSSVGGRPSSNTRGCSCLVTPRSSSSADLESF